MPDIARPPTLTLDDVVDPEADFTDTTKLELREMPPPGEDITLGRSCGVAELWRDELIIPFLAAVGVPRIGNGGPLATVDKEIRVWGPLGLRRLQWLVRLYTTGTAGTVRSTLRPALACTDDCPDTPGPHPARVVLEDRRWDDLVARLIELIIWTLAEEELPYEPMRDGRSIIVERAAGLR